MIQKLLCWLFGHKTVFLATTGKILVTDDLFDRDVKNPLMVWARSKFCLRCGKIIHKEDK